MAKHSGLGPVFLSEWLCVRAPLAMVRGSIGPRGGFARCLAVIWWVRVGSQRSPSVQTQAAASQFFWAAITMTQLAVVLLAAPAATAGAICLDRARGTLAHVLVNRPHLGRDCRRKGGGPRHTRSGNAPLYVADPVARKRARRYRRTARRRGDAGDGGRGDDRLLGGPGPLDLGYEDTRSAPDHVCRLGSLARSRCPMWTGYLLVMRSGSAPPTWFAKANPVWLVAASYLWPNAVGTWDHLVFLESASWSRPGSSPSPSPSFARAALVKAAPPTSLPRTIPGHESSPESWASSRARRWTRTRSLARVASKAAVAMGGRRLVAVRHHDDRAHDDLIALNSSGSPVRRGIASIGNGFQAGIGLLLLSISAATALAEERVRGQLDVLLATPLSTRSIVWGKWSGAFRAVPIVAICPGCLRLVLARQSGRWEGAALVAGLFLAYGAAVTSMGLGLATWIRRLDFAVALNVAVLGGVTVGWLLRRHVDGTGTIHARPRRRQPDHRHPFPDGRDAIHRPEQWAELCTVWLLWITVYLLIASALGLITLITFDRCLGRMPEATSPRTTDRHASRKASLRAWRFADR